MSEPENTDVTAPATKKKNPKRVAQGKRLAEIPKAAKEKKRLRIEEGRKASDVCVYIHSLYFEGNSKIFFK